jgi:hypothetical protein
MAGSGAQAVPLPRWQPDLEPTSKILREISFVCSIKFIRCPAIVAMEVGSCPVFRDVPCLALPSQQWPRARSGLRAPQDARA